MKMNGAKILTSLFLISTISMVTFANAAPGEIPACKNPEELKPKLRKDASGSNKIETRCKMSTPAYNGCFGTLTHVENLYNSFSASFKEHCSSLTSFGSRIGDLATIEQADAQNRVIELTGQGVDVTDKIIQKTDEILSSAISQSQKNVTALEAIKARKGVNLPANFSSLITNISNAQKSAKTDASKLNSSPASSISVDNIDKISASTPVLSEVKTQAIAVAQTFDFARKLLKNRADSVVTRNGLSEQRNSAVAAKNGLGVGNDGSADGSANGDEPGGLLSGFKPTDLLALAPLATMLMQKQPTPPAEDPFQSGIGGNTPPPPLPSAKLNPKTGSSETKSPTPETPAESPKTPEINSIYADAYTGEEETPSDITKGTQGGNGNGSGNGVSGGSSGFNAGGGSGSSEGAGDLKSRNPASNPTAEEALQGFGGSGLGFSPGSSNSSGSELESLADPMKDMLDPDTLGGADTFDTNLGEDAGAQTLAAGDVLLEDSESLFPRVRACHVRALKKGWVLHGLGEKLSEIDE